MTPARPTFGALAARLLVAAAALLHGCGRSALIRADDPTYRRAIDHYRRTRALVTAA